MIGFIRDKREKGMSDMVEYILTPPVLAKNSVSLSALLFLFTWANEKIELFLTSFVQDDRTKNQPIG